MATGAKMAGFNFYKQGTYGTLPQNGTKDMEVSHDMHLKMSKKIAQLTKVIYALNTKNDEHEAIVNTLKEQHEKQTQQLLAETKGKLESYKSKLGSDLDNRRRIESLEQAVTEHERQKKAALLEFELFKKQAEEMETELKTAHSQKMLALSKDVLKMKKDFEDQVAKIKLLQEGFEHEKLVALDELRQAHRVETEQLLKTQRLQSSGLEEQKAELEKQFGGEIERLKEACEQLKKEKEKDCEEYEFKLSKAQAFYEKELKALSERQNASDNEQLRLLQEQYDAFKKDAQFQEGQFKKRVDELIGQLSLSEEETEKLKHELAELQTKLKSKDSNISSLTKQLSDAKQEMVLVSSRLKDVESELAASKERCAEQAAEMLNKSTQLGELEATRIQQEKVIGELKGELGKLKDRLNWLETERKSLENKSQSQAQQQGSQLASLERALEDMSIEKQTMKERYDRDMKNLQDKFQTEISTLISDYENKMVDLKKSHADSMESSKKDNENSMDKLKQELEEKMEALRQQLEEERSKLTSEHEEVKAGLTQKLETALNEIKRLEKLVSDSEKGLGNASSNINSLKEESNKLRSQLDEARSQLRLITSNKDSLQTELDKQLKLHNEKMEESRVELKSKLDQLGQDLDAKWTETLRRECEKLRRDVTAQKDEDRRAAMEQLTRLKEDELTSVRDGWKIKEAELMKQISALKNMMNSQNSKASEDLDHLRRELEAENKRLLEKMLESADEYAEKIASMERSQAEKLSKLEEVKDKEKMESEQTLRQRHLEDMQAQMTAHRLTVDSIREQAEMVKEKEVTSLEKKHMEVVEKLKSDLSSQHEQELDQHKRAHTTQMAAARMELDRAMEISRHKEKDHEMKISEMKEEIGRRERHISNLDEEVKKKEKELEATAKEVMEKGREILKVRSEATQALRKQEEQLAHQHRAEVDHLNHDHLSETQQMLEEFNRAQELLKDKISALQFMLEEAEDRYRNRESRPEDIERIAELQQAVEERAMEMKKLLDDKKFYQMELVNRETNFNKVFTGDPKVGVLNPLMKKKKGERGQVERYVSAPSLNQMGTHASRLQPLPNSPNHDEKLNPHKALPPPFGVKKFLS